LRRQASREPGRVNIDAEINPKFAALEEILSRKANLLVRATAGSDGEELRPKMNALEAHI